MISLLSGVVADLAADHVVMDCHGVGYQAFCPTRTLGALQTGKPAKLYIITHVREDALQLFGFIDKPERDAFTLITGVSGVGPRIALSLLSTLSGAEIAAAVSTNQPSMLARANGVGKKLAEKIIVELKDKAQTLALAEGSLPHVTRITGPIADITSALVNLGYQPKTAETAAAKAIEDLPDAPFADQFRLALKKCA